MRDETQQDHCPEQSAPRMRFSTRWLPERDRLDIWHEEFGRRFVRLEVGPLNDGPLLYETAFQSYGRASVGMGEISAISCARTKEMLGDGNADIVLLIPQSGNIGAEQGRIDETIEAGHCLVRRSSEVGRTSLQPGGFLTLNLPVEQLSERVANIDLLSMAAIQPDNPALQLLKTYCGALAAQDTEAFSQAHFKAVDDYLIDLASLAIGANRDAWHQAKDRGVRAARRLAVQATIRKHAANPDYRIAELARGMHVSESYIRKLLAEGGQTFSSILLGVRLDLAHARLTDPRFDGIMISQIALDSGFNDISYFNHAFSRRFDMTPTECRRNS